MTTEIENQLKKLSLSDISNVDDDKIKKCTRCHLKGVIGIDFEVRVRNSGKREGKTEIRSQCKKCRSKSDMEYRNKTTESREAYLTKMAEWNKSEIGIEKKREYYQNNKEEIYKKNRERISANPEKQRESQRKYASKPEVKERNKEQARIRFQKDTSARMRKNMRTRIANLLKSKKQNKTDELLGCTKEHLEKFIEFQAKDKYTWDNYGKDWHIDHVIPLAFFDMDDPDEYKIGFNWTNLRPLDAKENMYKSYKIVKEDIENHHQTLDEFLSLNTGYQANVATCWWWRAKLQNGNNSQDEENYENFLKRVIRNKDVLEEEH